jgi:hypothetical protein
MAKKGFLYYAIGRGLAEPPAAAPAVPAAAAASPAA